MAGADLDRGPALRRRGHTADRGLRPALPRRRLCARARAAGDRRMTPKSVRSLGWSQEQELEPLLTREWLVSNGRGGYASGSIAGVPTRRFHGLLIAALPAPIGRAMMLNHLFETLELPDQSIVRLGGYERESGPLEVFAAPVLREFRLDHGLPVWRFEMG